MGLILNFVYCKRKHTIEQIVMIFLFIIYSPSILTKAIPTVFIPARHLQI